MLICYCWFTAPGTRLMGMASPAPGIGSTYFYLFIVIGVRYFVLCVSILYIIILKCSVPFKHAINVYSKYCKWKILIRFSSVFDIQFLVKRKIIIIKCTEKLHLRKFINLQFRCPSSGLYTISKCGATSILPIKCHHGSTFYRPGVRGHLLQQIPRLVSVSC
jgi:hypothetical protein